MYRGFYETFRLSDLHRTLRVQFSKFANAFTIIMHRVELHHGGGFSKYPKGARLFSESNGGQGRVLTTLVLHR